MLFSDFDCRRADESLITREALKRFLKAFSVKITTTKRELIDSFNRIIVSYDGPLPPSVVLYTFSGMTNRNMSLSLSDAQEILRSHNVYGRTNAKEDVIRSAAEYVHGEEVPLGSQTDSIVNMSEYGLRRVALMYTTFLPSPSKLFKFLRDNIISVKRYKCPKKFLEDYGKCMDSRTIRKFKKHDIDRRADEIMEMSYSEVVTQRDLRYHRHILSYCGIVPAFDSHLDFFKPMVGEDPTTRLSESLDPQARHSRSVLYRISHGVYKSFDELEGESKIVLFTFFMTHDVEMIFNVVSRFPISRRLEEYCFIIESSPLLSMKFFRVVMSAGYPLDLIIRFRFYNLGIFAVYGRFLDTNVCGERIGVTVSDSWLSSYGRRYLMCTNGHHMSYLRRMREILACWAGGNVYGVDDDNNFVRIMVLRYRAESGVNIEPVMRNINYLTGPEFNILAEAEILVRDPWDVVNFIDGENMFFLKTPLAPENRTTHLTLEDCSSVNDEEVVHYGNPASFQRYTIEELEMAIADTEGGQTLRDPAGGYFNVSDIAHLALLLSHYGRRANTISDSVRTYIRNSGRNSVKRLKNLSGEKLEAAISILETILNIGLRFRRWPGPGFPIPYDERDTLTESDPIELSAQSITEMSGLCETHTDVRDVIFELPVFGCRAYDGNRLGSLVIGSTRYKASDHEELCIRMVSRPLISTCVKYLKTLGRETDIDVSRLDSIS